MEPANRNGPNMRSKRIDHAETIIRYLHSTTEGRSLQEISYAVRIPYTTVRLIIKEHFPHCFVEKPYVGWTWTGEKPVKELPFDINEVPPEPEPQVQAVEKDKPVRTGVWVWNQDALRFLDQFLVPGMTLSEILTKAKSEGRLRDFDIIGKTLSRAAMQYEKTGKIPYEQESSS